jgi:hypothetical protein
MFLQDARSRVKGSEPAPPEHSGFIYLKVY